MILILLMADIIHKYVFLYIILIFNILKKESIFYQEKSIQVVPLHKPTFIFNGIIWWDQIEIHYCDMI